MHQPFLTVKQIAALLSRSEDAIRALVYRRAIPYRVIGGRIMFIEDEITEWLKTVPGVTLKEIQFSSK